jgi:hypothetical protein
VCDSAGRSKRKTHRFHRFSLGFYTKEYHNSISRALTNQRPKNSGIRHFSQLSLDVYDRLRRVILWQTHPVLQYSQWERAERKYRTLSVGHGAKYRVRRNQSTTAPKPRARAVLVRHQFGKAYTIWKVVTPLLRIDAHGLQLKLHERIAQSGF